MTRAVERLRSELGSLSERERAALAYYLLSTLHPSEDAVAEAWRAEVADRVDDILAGKVDGKSADQLFAELRELYP
jgi:putative addiction module component (TIGR02574 family)